MNVVSKRLGAVASALLSLLCLRGCVETGDLAVINRTGYLLEVSQEGAEKLGFQVAPFSHASGYVDLESFPVKARFTTDKGAMEISYPLDQMGNARIEGEAFCLELRQRPGNVPKRQWEFVSWRDHSSVK